MRITTLLTTTLLIGIAYAAMSADEITKCLDDIATQFSDADTKAQGIDLTSFIGLQSQIIDAYATPINRAKDCSEQLSQEQEPPNYAAEQQQQICSAYKASIQPHQSFLNTLTAKRTAITGYGAGPPFASLVAEDRKATDAFAAGVSNAVPDCVQDVSEAQAAMGPVFDQTYSALNV